MSSVFNEPANEYWHVQTFGGKVTEDKMTQTDLVAVKESSSHNCKLYENLLLLMQQNTCTSFNALISAFLTSPQVLKQSSSSLNVPINKPLPKSQIFVTLAQELNQDPFNSASILNQKNNDTNPVIVTEQENDFQTSMNSEKLSQTTVISSHAEVARESNLPISGEVNKENEQQISQESANVIEKNFQQASPESADANKQCAQPILDEVYEMETTKVSTSTNKQRPKKSKKKVQENSSGVKSRSKRIKLNNDDILSISRTSSPLTAKTEKDATNENDEKFRRPLRKKVASSMKEVSSEDELEEMKSIKRKFLHLFVCKFF